jgi:PAS domain S-box-containing protein
VNAQAERLFGYRRDELLGRPVEILMPERYRDSHLGHRAAYVAAPTARPMGAGFRLSARTRDGGEFPVEISLSPLETEDETLTIAGIRDVSERRRAEERLVTSLKEKETLLTEVHHRVKNNLQIVSSLMNLASAPITDPTARGVFRTSRHRIHAMAAIHDRLYRSQSFGRVDAGEYVTSLAGDLLRSYELAPARVALTTDVHHVLLSLDTAIPCGLIVNELVSNALEHAFPPPGRGTIHVGLREAPAGVCIVQVRDDGIGFPDDFDLQQVTSVGLRLVVALARQLGGTVSVQRAPGAEFTIRFPLEQEAVAPSAEGEGAGPA